MKESVSFLINNLLKKGLLLAIIFTFVATSFAQEGDKKDVRYGGFARIYSMGDNPYIIDPDNVKYNTAYSSVYSNFLWGDIGSTAASLDDGFGQFIAFNYRVSKEFTIGAMLSRNDFSSGNIASPYANDLVSQINYNVTGAAIVPLDNNFELLTAYSFGNFVIGLGASYASTTNDFTPATGTGNKNGASQFGVNLGILGKLTPQFNLDAAFSLVLPSAKFTPGTGDVVEASGTYMMANARGFLKLSKAFTLVPTLSFANQSGSFSVGSQSFDFPSMMSFGVGIGLSYQVENVIISGGPALMFESTTTPADPNASQPELKDSRFVFPAWNFGAEWFLTDWLIGRLGYVASTFSQTTQTAASSTTVNERTRTNFGRGDIRLGVGFRFGSFSLDATVNDDILREGFRIVGGPNNTFAYLSASFAF
ncbi:MAG: hypothetical protein B6D44_09200 [Ignavibacteriales bacterium UTCHB2]|jgi:hypothetical protein|nr:MAG: hypothetical protein BWY38_01112 [Ignavibacteria bacterium ADurb.Bin266]OQY72768.1 MAG: hypothetical protein B6D44_09200 [Ignavibacteriales bacterium UTCHB2]HQI40664.1 hypothetical protein [Ignavibacteriaceae bacterium]